MNKYKIARNFLEKCLTYFSRRACLHYIGSMFAKANQIPDLHLKKY